MFLTAATSTLSCYRWRHIRRLILEVRVLFLFPPLWSESAPRCTRVSPGIGRSFFHHRVARRVPGSLASSAYRPRRRLACSFDSQQTCVRIGASIFTAEIVLPRFCLCSIGFFPPFRADHNPHSLGPCRNRRDRRVGCGWEKLL